MVDLSWLDAGSFRGSVKQFAEFCHKDSKHQSFSNQAEADIYEQSVRLVLDKLQSSNIENDLLEDNIPTLTDIAKPVTDNAENVKPQDVDDIITEKKDISDKALRGD